MTRSSGAASRGRTIAASVAVLACLAGAIALQVVRDRLYGGQTQQIKRMLYVRSGEAARRLVLDFDALAADVYWIRAIQHYGGERLSTGRVRNYELLYPLLDLTTSLDPYFSIAYRFGAIFLGEAVPGGPGRPDQAVALLEKGISVQPDKWQYYHDVAFVYYWHLHDLQAAAQWFLKAADRPNSPTWLRPMAASVLSATTDRSSARFLWRQILQSDEEWLKKTAARSLMQLDTADAIDQLEAVVQRFPPPSGEPYSWPALIEQRVLRAVPADPTGTPLDIDPATGDVRVSTASALYPMPESMHRR